MTGRVEPRCRRCTEPFDPEVVLARFLVDVAARTGFAHTGSRPRWPRQYCSEPCRNADLRDRAAAMNETMSRRRSARRAARR
jgi:hypothetical protein